MALQELMKALEISSSRCSRGCGIRIQVELWPADAKRSPSCRHRISSYHFIIPMNGPLLGYAPIKMPVKLFDNWRVIILRISHFIILITTAITTTLLEKPSPSSVKLSSTGEHLPGEHQCRGKLGINHNLYKTKYAAIPLPKKMKVITRVLTIHI